MSQRPSGPQRLEGPDLEALLAKVRTDFGEGATIVEANRVRRGGVGGFFAKESFEVLVEPAQRDDDPEVQEDEAFVPLSVEELAGRVDDPAPDFSAALAAALEEAAPNPPEPEPDPGLAWPAAAAIAEVAPVVAAAPRIARLVHGGLDGLDAAVPQRAPAPPAPAPLPDRDLDALARLGLPLDRLALPIRTDEPAAVALVRLLEQLPVPPAMPQGAGAVLAVVGGRGPATGLAAELAVRLGTDDADVVVAGRRRGADLRTAADVDERRRSWRRRRRPTLVVVDAAFGIEPDEWATEVLAALEPVVALGHVDAGRKPEDVRAWADGVGGLDALAVDGLDATTTPAAVLGAGIPVALLDGAPATPARWAALLTDRLAALAA